MRPQCITSWMYSVGSIWSSNDVNYFIGRGNYLQVIQLLACNPCCRCVFAVPSIRARKLVRADDRAGGRSGSTSLFSLKQYRWKHSYIGSGIYIIHISTSPCQTQNIHQTWKTRAEISATASSGVRSDSRPAKTISVATSSSFMPGIQTTVRHKMLKRHFSI